MHGPQSMAGAEQIVGLDERMPLAGQMRGQFVDLRAGQRVKTQAGCLVQRCITALRSAGMRACGEDGKGSAGVKYQVQARGGRAGWALPAVPQVRQIARVAWHLAGEFPYAYISLRH